MRNRILICSAVLFLGCQAAQAQFGKIKGKIDSITAKYKDIEITDQEEIQLGTNISERIRAKFGVVQDPEIHKYVTLVGMALVKKSSRPNLPYHFIVLDTDGVNAFAAPGGFVHITRGALSLMKNEAELAGVLGHELVHITERHTIKAVQKNKAFQMAAGQTSLSANPDLMRRVQDEMFKIVFAGFGRSDELESDEKGLAVAANTGYEASGLKQFLTALKERNAGSEIKQGLFASHPEMDERLQKIDSIIKQNNWSGGAVNPERLAKYVKYKPVPLAEIAVVQEGAAGLAGGGKEGEDKDKDKKKEDDQQEPKKKSRFSLSKLKNPLGGGEEKTQSAEVTGSGGSRGVDKERMAKGGSNPAVVAVTITDQELQAFKKEGKLKA
ncbi:MAG TPA: M48 family metalloprotease [Acidobacteriota bacterium]|nr:M48 family metalloprotease [Acidobacteriota bacterium]